MKNGGLPGSRDCAAILLMLGCGPEHFAVGVGGPPICPYGYYEAPPYACARMATTGRNGFQAAFSSARGPGIAGLLAFTATSITRTTFAKAIMVRFPRAARRPYEIAFHFAVRQCTTRTATRPLPDAGSRFRRPPDGPRLLIRLTSLARVSPSGSVRRVY